MPLEQTTEYEKPNGTGGNLPQWARTAAYLGVPSVLALYFAYNIVSGIVPAIEAQARQYDETNNRVIDALNRNTQAVQLLEAAVNGRVRANTLIPVN